MWQACLLQNPFYYRKLCLWETHKQNMTKTAKVGFTDSQWLQLISDQFLSLSSGNVSYSNYSSQWSSWWMTSKVKVISIINCRHDWIICSWDVSLWTGTFHSLSQWLLSLHPGTASQWRLTSVLSELQGWRPHCSF